MTHKGTRTIETDKLTLRQFTTDDAEAMFANWANDPEVTSLLEKERAALGKNGRVILRESGTEPVVRVMVEAQTQKGCDVIASRIVNKIEELGYSKK